MRGSVAVLLAAAAMASGGCGDRGPRDVARRIAAATRQNDGAWDKIATLTDEIDPRLSGSEGLERAILWARDTLANEGHENVALEKVRVLHWVRGAEVAELVGPAQPRRLAVLALGGSVGTPAEGVIGQVLVVDSFDALEKAGPAVAGKIVLFNHVMRADLHPARAYGEALPYRLTGAARAGKLGAAAVLVRSLTTRSLGVPHTGAMLYPPDAVRRIPAAAISVEDAELLARLARRGQPVKVRMALGAQTLPDAESANVLAELRGRERPEEIVLISAHIDSWDVSPGAQDNAAGCAIVMEALATLRRLGLVPRRTIRVALFTAEEKGVSGAKQYAVDHAAELAGHVAAFETDTGAGAPLGFTTEGHQPWASDARALAHLLAPLGANKIFEAYPGQDVMELKAAGVPLLGLAVDMTHYFDVHHSVADTLEKIDPDNLRRNVAVMATMAFLVADRPETFRAPVSGTGAASPAESRTR